MKSLVEVINEAKTDVLSVPEAFMYCRNKLGIRCRWETIIEDRCYEISPGYGNAAEYTFVLENSIHNKYGAVIYCPRGLRLPNAFTFDKSLQKPDIYFEKRELGMDKQYWRPTKEVLDKLLESCLR